MEHRKEVIINTHWGLRSGMTIAQRGEALLRALEEREATRERETAGYEKDIGSTPDGGGVHASVIPQQWPTYLVEVSNPDLTYEGSASWPEKRCPRKMAEKCFAVLADALLKCDPVRTACTIAMPKAAFRILSQEKLAAEFVPSSPAVRAAYAKVRAHILTHGVRVEELQL